MQIPLFYLFGYLLHSEEISDQSTHTNGSNFIGADQELKENIYGDAGFPTGFKNMGGCALQLLMLARTSGFFGGVANMGDGAVLFPPPLGGGGVAPQNLMEGGFSQNLMEA